VKKLRLSMLLLLALLAMTLPVHADTGPKPSVTIQVVGTPEEPCYITLLSERGSTGPHTSMKARYPNPEEGPTWDDPYNYYNKNAPDYPIWEKFRSFELRDDFYFLQTFEQLSPSGQYSWGYYPPSTFKALLYFPEQDSFLVSSVYTRYAFHSYYTLDLTGAELSAGATVSQIPLQKSYDYGQELLSLAFRAGLTLLLELGVAWIMGLRSRGQMAYIALVNLFTQGALNAALFFQAYRSGPYGLWLLFFLLEGAVLLTEFLLYLFLPGRRELPLGRRASLSMAYALPANLCSLVLGGLLALFLPSLF